ncbi:MAG: hypothetical protein IJM88_04280 [Bacteroidales bacterium]|nr:hypothetical protein [Bacteroidales bacterium]
MARKNNRTIHSFFAIGAIVLIIGILLYTIFGGSKQRDILGTWVTDTAEVESGFQCGRQGIAASVKDATTQYNNWELRGHNLILSGKRFADRRVNAFSDTLLVKSLSSSRLVVEQEGHTVRYKKIR